MRLATIQRKPLARTDRPFRAWYLSQQRLSRLAANDVGANARATEDDTARETEEGELREVES